MLAIEKAFYDQAKYEFHYNFKGRVWSIMEREATNLFDGRKQEILGMMQEWFNKRLPELIETNSRKILEKYTSDFTRRLIGR